MESQRGCYVVASGANLVRKDKSQSTLRRQMLTPARVHVDRKAHPQTQPCTDQALRHTRPSFRQAGSGHRPSKLVLGSPGGSHVPGQPSLSNRGFKKQNPLPRHIWRYLGQRNAFPSWPVGPRRRRQCGWAPAPWARFQPPTTCPHTSEVSALQRIMSPSSLHPILPPEPPLVIINKPSLADGGSRRNFPPTESELSAINSHR